MRTAMIINKRGLHARAAAKLAKVVSGFNAEVSVSKCGQTVSGQSIMGLMMLAAAQGSEITLKASGPDQDRALEALCTLINDRFGEDIA